MLNSHRITKQTPLHLLDSDLYQRNTFKNKKHQFWHKYLSREKTERYIEKYASENKLFWLGTNEDVINDLKKKLSRFPHDQCAQR